MTISFASFTISHKLSPTRKRLWTDVTPFKASMGRDDTGSIVDDYSSASDNNRTCSSPVGDRHIFAQQAQ